MKAIVPIRTPATAKSRLRGALPDPAREALVLAMAGHVLSALKAAPAITGVVAVSAGREIEELAARLAVATLRQPEDRGMNEDIAAAIEALDDRSGGVMIVAADMPFASSAAFGEVAAACVPGTVVIVPDRHGTGTNVLAIGQGVRLAPAFGANSFERHRRSAEAAGARSVVLNVAALSFDVDTPDDLALLKASGDRNYADIFA